SMFSVVADVSRSTRTLVVGEDLGTVRPEFRDRLRDADIQSYRVLMFERDQDGVFIVPDDWPAQALACAATHDLPTVAGWWTGEDLADMNDRGLLATEEFQEARGARERDREALADALRAAGLDVEADTDVEGFALAVHTFLARTPCRLMAVQIEDLLGLKERANQPGTLDEYPNWRMKLPVSVDEVPAIPLFGKIVRAIRSERGPSP
ncbi:MAG: 4-alpha-glucanotransferase, partial [Alphaproteobacteria bacterium]|nr:4-alpha-glucanotransferase [Alphaproteobacteria bacterium]